MVKRKKIRTTRLLWCLTEILSERLQLFCVECVVVLHTDNFGAVRPGLERVDKLLFF